MSSQSMNGDTPSISDRWNSPYTVPRFSLPAMTSAFGKFPSAPAVTRLLGQFLTTVKEYTSLFPSTSERSIIPAAPRDAINALFPTVPNRTGIVIAVFSASSAAAVSSGFRPNAAFISSATLSAILSTPLHSPSPYTNAFLPVLIFSAEILYSISHPVLSDPVSFLIFYHRNNIAAIEYLFLFGERSAFGSNREFPETERRRRSIQRLPGGFT